MTCVLAWHLHVRDFTCPRTVFIFKKMADKNQTLHDRTDLGNYKILVTVDVDILFDAFPTFITFMNTRISMCVWISSL